ncbi:MAG: hypothetical protein HY452_00605 [Parcubacteria group bacterium]|nr:hypothetical protein [Parcubacteria group bacterium]
MTSETTLIFNINVGSVIIGILVFSFSLLAVIWKAKSEIADTINKELSPFKSIGINITNAIVEVQTILRNRFKGVNIVHGLVERGSSPLNPTEYGARLIKDSGLEKILEDNREFLCTKLKASLPRDYTEYDVQEKARELLLFLKDDPILNPVKNWIYHNPVIDIEIILKAGGLWLRDDFLGHPRKIAENKDEVA